MVAVVLIVVFLLFSWLGMIINGGTFYTALGCGAVTICASVIIIKKLDTIIEMMKENNNAGFYRHYSKTKSDKDDENDDK
jgi:hypothetical protein